MKKCLVTGGAGFIGSHIAEALVKRGDHVRVLDNMSTGQPEANLESVKSAIEFVKGDLRHPADVAQSRARHRRYFS